MSYATISVEQHGPAAVIRLNRPEKRNAINLQAFAELTDAFELAGSNSSVRAIILTGTREFFCAGADLNDALKLSSAEESIHFFKTAHRLCDTLENLPKPTIAAIEGYCMTGGLEIALACDLRVAGKSSSFAITSARIGTVAGFGGTQRLPRVVGRGAALEMLFSAEPFNADHAYRIGLINGIADDGEALTKALDMAEHYATRAPLSLSFVKRAVYRGLDMDQASAIELETFIATTIYGTEDRKEGISAFLERRPTQFKGR